MTAEEALQQAEAEGLTLLRSESSSTGYMGVSFTSGNQAKSRPYEAKVARGGRRVYLGLFVTAEEAALSIARTPEGRAAAAAPPAPAPLTTEEAVQQAEAEGLTLLRSESSNSGYTGVTFTGGRSKSMPYQAQVRSGSRQVHLGRFATPEEAALHVARSPAAQAAAAAALLVPPPMPAKEAVQQAETEGLTLLRSESSTGYKGVAFNGSRKRKPYEAHVRRGGKDVHLGCFATPEEAALSIARTPAARLAAPPEPPSLTAEEALQQAEAEGLTLLRSASSNSGFRCVSFRSGKSKPYQAQLYRGGKKVNLGHFATPEEAALCYARTPEAQAAAPQPPAASSRKRKAKPEEQPRDEPADVVVILEGRFVESTAFE